MVQITIAHHGDRETAHEETIDLRFLLPNEKGTLILLHAHGLLLLVMVFMVHIHSSI